MAGHTQREGGPLEGGRGWGGGGGGGVARLCSHRHSFTAALPSLHSSIVPSSSRSPSFLHCTVFLSQPFISPLCRLPLSQPSISPLCRLLPPAVHSSIVPSLSLTLFLRHCAVFVLHSFIVRSSPLLFCPEGRKRGVGGGGVVGGV